MRLKTIYEHPTRDALTTSISSYTYHVSTVCTNVAPMQKGANKQKTENMQSNRPDQQEETINGKVISAVEIQIHIITGKLKSIIYY